MVEQLCLNGHDPSFLMPKPRGSKDDRPLNLKDIARKSGVSKSTVSRVVNGGVNVSEKTLERVRAVIEQEGFVPNPGGRILHLQQTFIIGIVLLHNIQDIFEDPYYFPLFLQGVNQATHARNYATLLWIDAGVEDEEQFFRRILANRMMDGLVIASSRMNSPVIERLLDANMKFVMVERPSNHASRVNYVVSDTLDSARGAVRHLIRSGYRRIGTITGRLDHVDGLDRLEGYRQALADAGLPFDPALVVEGDFTYASGYASVQALLDRHVEALFAATDRTALGALQAIHEAGLRVPDDFALVGYDNLAQYVQPPVVPLTSVDHHVLEKSRIATEILIDLIEGKLDAPQQISLPTELVVRASSAPRRG
ncbi:MAG: LacI family DNA-binding transcriptional regulator [Chloroflexi bacterium]|nr:LacI family DNA-binding transcriptional regulator [Chloroflexota bacterium]